MGRFSDRLGRWVTWAVDERLRGPLTSFGQRLAELRALGVPEEQAVRHAAYFAGNRGRRSLGSAWAETFIPLFRAARAAGVPERDAIIEAGRRAAQK